MITYIAHPDLFRFTGSNRIYAAEMQRICRSAVTTGTPLEINFLGIRDGRHYPDERFWRIAGEERAPVTFGFDAHRPEDAFDAASLKTALDMVDRLGLNYIGEPQTAPAAIERAMPCSQRYFAAQAGVRNTGGRAERTFL